MLRKILHPLYVIYQFVFAWWAMILLTAITSIVIYFFGGMLKIKKADYYPAVLWCKLVCWVFLIPVKVVDRRKYVDQEKNYIFVANHQGLFDVFIMYGHVVKDFKWIMKDSLRKVPLMGAACEKTGHIFVNRTTPQKDMLRKAINILRSGKSMSIFAEGTRCLHGKLGRFKKGAFVIANMTQMPIIPVTIEGSYDILPKGCRCAHWSKVTLTFHEAIECKGRDAENVEYLMRTTRNVIAKDLGADIEPEPAVPTTANEPVTTNEEQ